MRSVLYYYFAYCILPPTRLILVALRDVKEFVFCGSPNHHMEGNKRFGTYNLYTIPNGRCFQIKSLIFPAFFAVEKIWSLLLEILLPALNLPLGTTSFFLLVFVFFYWSLLISTIQNTILTNKERRYKTKIKGTDKIQLLYGMLQLLITKKWNRHVKSKNNQITEITKQVKLVCG